MPFYLVYSWSSKILVTTKNHFSIEKKRNLTLKELFKIKQNKLLYSEQYTKNKIDLIHNSQEEILNFTKEAINIFHDQNFDHDQNLQKNFGLILKTY